MSNKASEVLHEVRFSYKPKHVLNVEELALEDQNDSGCHGGALGVKDGIKLLRYHIC